MSLCEEDRVFLEERREKILGILRRQRRASVVELAQAFRIGEATIRRDLSDLEGRGLVQRTHGGVVVVENTGVEISVRERETHNHEAKQRIADFIADLVHDNETIMIDAGSTTHIVARMLRGKSRLVVVTNSPDVANELAVGGIQVIVTGGELCEPTRALVGPVAEFTVRQFRADKAILGMSALNIDEGLFTVSHQEAAVKRVMIADSAKTIIAVDSSKFGKVMRSFVCGISSVDMVVTDRKVPEEYLRSLEGQGVTVVAV